MSRKRLGSIDQAGVSEARNVAEQRVQERRGMAAAKAPPIGKVAGAAGQSIEEELLRLRRQNDTLQSETQAFTEARSEGLVVLRVPLEKIDAHALARDRRTLDKSDEAWEELKVSLRARGQQTPIELSEPATPSEKYTLVSGYRRLAALKDLFEETGDPQFSTVKALISGAGTTVDAMVAMIEENEIRQDVSFYERGRICCLAVEQGVCTSVDDALQILFASSSRNRRYKIRNFTVIHSQIGGALDYPEHIGERLGARLAQALKEGRARDLMTVLSDRDSKFTEPAEELALLQDFVAQSGRFAAAAPSAEMALNASLRLPSGVSLQAKAKNGRMTLRIDGLDVSDDQDLSELLARLAEVCETP